ncbi:MAG: cysteine desulfurase-like protein [Propionibacteriaceae bacterium]
MHDHHDAPAPGDSLRGIRADFPALLHQTAHFDSPGGTQTPEPVINAIAEALRNPLANQGFRTQAERNAEEIVDGARAAMGDLLNADPRGIVFGRSATSLTFQLAQTLATGWGPGDEVVVTRLDHDANIRPWVIAAEAVGATVRWAEFDPETGEQPVEAVTGLLSERTRLVAVTAASNLIGTMPDVPAISAAARALGAHVHVDAVHYAAHKLVDLRALGCHTVTCSPYKFLGPHLGVLAADPSVLEELRPAKLLPAGDTVPERFEQGTLPYELLAGTRAAVDYLAAFADASGKRRDQLTASFDLIAEHDQALLERLDSGLRAIPGVRIFSAAVRRTSTTLFNVDGHDSSDLSDHLASRGVNAPASSFYAIEASRHLGLGGTGAIRAGIAPYTTSADVDRLLAGLSSARSSY